MPDKTFMHLMIQQKNRPVTLFEKVAFKNAFSDMFITIVIKYSGLAIGFGPFLGENLWQLSRLA